MRARKGSWGDGYTEIRFRRGTEFNESLSEVQLREAYVNLYMGNFDVRIGQQIVVWGRADAFNPTNNITPQNFLIRSSDEDDRRMGNFLIRTSYYWNPFRFQLLWVPQYVPSVIPIPLQLFQLPLNTYFDNPIHPDSRLKNSTIAAKADLEISDFSGSISYFRGYMPMPGVTVKEPYTSENFEIFIPIAIKSYRMDVFGADFSTTVSSFGLRGEAAYRHPVDDYVPQKEDLIDSTLYIPNPDFQLVLGLDKSIGDFSIILQYIGRYVFEFTDINYTKFVFPQIKELENRNRMIASQLDEISHAVFMRPSLSLLHETIDMELLAYYSITTKESLVKPVFSYDLTDDLTVKVGGEWYSGPDNTLFGTIERALSTVFAELKVSF